MLGLSMRGMTAQLAEIEVWRDVPGYEGLYAVSSLGRVRSAPRRGTRGGLLAQSISSNGYPSVGLFKSSVQRTRTVHSLVAEAFLGPPPAGQEVLHRDDDKLNPTLANLHYDTRTENRLDRVRLGTDHNVNKTHCPRGHAYEGANVYRIPSRPTARYCRTCNNSKSRWSG